MALSIILDVSEIANEVDRRTSLIMARTRSETGEVIDEIRAASTDTTTLDLVERELENFNTIFNRYIATVTRASGTDSITYSMEVPEDTNATVANLTSVLVAMITAKVVYEWMVLNRIGDQAQHSSEEYRSFKSRAFQILSLRKRKAAAGPA